MLVNERVEDIRHLSKKLSIVNDHWHYIDFSIYIIIFMRANIEQELLDRQSVGLVIQRSWVQTMLSAIFD